MRQVKASGQGAFALAPTIRVTISTLPNLLSPINLHCHRIKDGGYKNIKSANKVSPTQNTPALQASKIQKTQDAYKFRMEIMEITSSINSRVRLWKINHSGAGCSFYEFYEWYIFQ